MERMPISFKLAGGKAGLKMPKEIAVHFQITPHYQKQSSLNVQIAIKT